ncbi:TolB family protein [Streptomyces coeruleorubidus]|uniref:TolB family protein n=1 Tax=Streptomyces coeruleorubidus TaxID=116188 RepID=UPI00365164C4
MRSALRAAVAAVASLCAVATAAPAEASEPRPGLEFVDVRADGVKGNGASSYPVVSADGRHVAFLSWATNLAPGDTDTTADVYVKDLRTGKLRWVSDVPDGQGEEVAFGTPSISADGTRVAFAALAPDTWPPPRDVKLPAYVHDTRTGRTERIDETTDPAFRTVSAPVLSGNGRYVTFAGRPTGTGNRFSIHVRDLRRGTGSWIDHPLPGGEPSLGSPTLSHDGSRVAYVAWNAGNGPGADHEGVYVLDRRTGERVRADADCAGDPADNGVTAPAISADGRHVAFRWKCLTLPSGGTSDTGDVFVRDLRRGTLRHVLGPRPQYATHSGRPSADAHRIVFAAYESEAGQRSRQVVYLRDLRTGRVDLVSARPDSTVNQRPAAHPTIDARGRIVAFDGERLDLQGEDGVSERQAFVTRVR